MALDIISYGESQEAKELALQNKIDQWQQTTIYSLNKYISENNLLYKCTAPHTSTTIFDNDILNWQLIGSNPIGVKNDNTLKISSISNINFVGAVVTDEGSGQVKVEISGGSALPYNVSTYTSTLNITTAIQIIYNWTNPTITNGFVKTVLFISTEDISASTYVFDLANVSGNIQKVKQGGTQGTSDSFAFDCTKDLTYYSKIFVVYDFGNGEVYSSGKNLTTTVVDTTPPVNPTSITAIAGNGQITVNWIDSISADTLGYLVRWQNSAFITTDKTEGNMLTDVGVGIHNVIHSGLSNTGSPMYYYKIFAYDNSKIANYNTSNVNTCSATLDGTPPLDVGTISQLALNQSIKVTWQTNDNSTIDWKGVRLVIKQGVDYPSNITDGTFIDIFNIATKTYSFGGLINNQTYSIQLFPFDTNLNYNTNTINRVQGTPFASALNNLLSFTCKNITNGLQIETDYKINYAPNGTTYQSTKIYGSKLTNLDGKTMVDCAGDSTVFLLKTDTTTTQGSSGTYVLSNTDTNLPFALGDMVYFKGFMVYLEGSSVGVSNGITAQDQTPPSVVTSLVARSGDSQIILSWINPTDPDFVGVKILRKEGSYPTSITDGILVYTGANTAYTDTTVINGTTYYYRVFPYDQSGNYNTTGTGQEVTATPQLVLAGAISNFTATSGNSQIVLSWINPTDEVFIGVKILRQTSTYPTSVTDGTVVYAGANTTYTDNTVVNGTTYYYRAFPYDINNNYNTTEVGQEISATPVVPVVSVIYGVKIDTTNSNPATALTYIEMAVGFTPATGNNGAFNAGSWADKFPFNLIKPCLYKNGAVNYYLNPNDYTQKVDGVTASDITSGADGDVMIEFPKIWWKFETIGTDLYIRYSNTQIDGAYKCLAHMRGVTEKDFCYISAYMGYDLTSELRSLSGKTLTATQTIGAFRTLAQANGTGYDQMAFYQLSMLQILYIVMFKNRDSQTALGRGYVDGNSVSIATGGANAKGLFYGETTGKLQNKFCGIEDFYGNVCYWIDGFFSGASRNILIANQTFNDTGSGYVDYGVGAVANTSGYIDTVQGGTETGFVVKTVAGSATTHYADYGFLFASRLPYFGGSWATADAAGAFYLSTSSSASTAAATVGARLLAL
ncbi:hypothetical protein [Clostridium sp.]|uniref:fibronectin type III domain-containing protein n=1 Tax=Clostridium sp. TaxID=1506 RepID=UPI001A53D1C3|nr:hypothetical protein [Clostridium sp.]MBK5239843.1 hypothetical protein [Clostridium sp.]